MHSGVLHSSFRGESDVCCLDMQTSGHVIVVWLVIRVVVLPLSPRPKLAVVLVCFSGMPRAEGRARNDVLGRGHWPGACVGQQATPVGPETEVCAVRCVLAILLTGLCTGCKDLVGAWLVRGTAVVGSMLKAILQFAKVHHAIKATFPRLSTQ